MSTPSVANSTAARLRSTALRDFAAPRPANERLNDSDYRFGFAPDEAPVPALIAYALNLIGLEAGGPGEKVAWWVDFTYRGYDCQVAHQKFGVRLYIAGTTEAEATTLRQEIAKKLNAAVRIVEAHLLSSAGAILDAGDATVANQSGQLQRTYEYFRDRATNPEVVADVAESGVSPGGGHWSSFRLGKDVMALNAFRNLVAAITAYVSLLEHRLVLALAFCDFDPAAESLTAFIGAKWGEKWSRIVGHDDPAAVELRRRLAAAVERWRNPYSHGGFEKGHGASVSIHVPGVGALPVGMTSIRDSPRFSLFPASESDISEVFALLDDIDAWLETNLAAPMRWIGSGLDVRYDAAFRAEVQAATSTPSSFQQMIDSYQFLTDRHMNMDY